MPSPIIFGFKEGDSLSSMNSLVIGAGATWGSVKMPFVPLEFTPERLADAIGPQNGYATGRLRLTNQIFYDQTYSGLPLATKRKFWGEARVLEKNAKGISLGLSGGAIMNSAAQALQSALRPIIRRLVSSVSLDVLQKSTSLDATLYGLDGRDTYNLNESDFRNANILFINAGLGALTQASLNLVFVGNFPSCNSMNPIRLVGHLHDVYRRASAWTIVPDGAVGVILPGASISIIAS